MRLLSERRDPRGKGACRSHAEADRRTDPAGVVWCVVPLLRAPSHGRGEQALRDGRCGMTDSRRESGLGIGDSDMSRRAMFKGTGPLVVSFTLTSNDLFGQAVATLVGSPPKELDGWLSIASDGTVTALTG